MVGGRNPGASQPRREGELVGGKYKLESRLGEGGMGVVFAARHMGTRRRVAVKCISAQANSITANARFMREAQVAGRIDHPNVVQVLDVGEDSRGRYIVMECLIGETLADVLKRRRLAPADAVDVLIPALRGVHAAHKQGIVHRDLKPENIFVCRAGDGPVQIKVLDFGISKLLEDDGGEQLTRTGALLGTPQYMSPDRMLGLGHADRRNDVYAMGVILYEALTGIRPFDGVDLQEVMKRIARQSAPAVNEIDPNLPAELAAVVRKAMAPNADDRYQDIESFARALEPFAGFERFQPQVRDPTERADGKSDEAEETSPFVPFMDAAVKAQADRSPPRARSLAPKPPGEAPPEGRPRRETPTAIAADAQGPRPDATRPPLVRPVIEVGGRSAPAPNRSAQAPRAPQPPGPRARAGEASYEELDALQVQVTPGAAAEEETRAVAKADDPLNAAVDKLLGRNPNVRPPPLPDARRGDPKAAADSLRALAPAHARQVRELMFQLSVGRTPRSWATACRSTIAALLEASRRIENKDLTSALDRFEAALKRAGAGTGTGIEADAASALQDAYRPLTSQLPEAFPDDSHADARRKQLFEAVVLRVPAMRKRIVAKLYTAGLTSLDQLGKAAPDDLAANTGLDRELAQALVRRAQQFERERQYQDASDLQLQTERRLRAVQQRLEALRIEFERAERDEAAERKRTIRQGREAALLELNQLLAEVGELELLDELERCPTSAKIQVIDRYLKRAAVPSE